MLASSSVNASPAINFALALAFKLANAVASLASVVFNSVILDLLLSNKIPVSLSSIIICLYSISDSF